MQGCEDHSGLEGKLPPYLDLCPCARSLAGAVGRRESQAGAHGLPHSGGGRGDPGPQANVREVSCRECQCHLH